MRTILHLYPVPYFVFLMSSFASFTLDIPEQMIEAGSFRYFFYYKCLFHRQGFLLALLKGSFFLPGEIKLTLSSKFEKWFFHVKAVLSLHVLSLLAAFSCLSDFHWEVSEYLRMPRSLLPSSCWVSTPLALVLDLIWNIFWYLDI